MSWKPIETAPRDGTVILIRGGETDEDMYSENDHGRFRALCSRPVTAFWLGNDFHPGWAIGFWDGDWRTYYENPSEWMPIPA